MTTIATNRLFYTHGLESLLLIGGIFTLIGLLLGWLLWRHCRSEADRVVTLNKDLRVKLDSLEASQNELTQILNELP